MYEAEPRLVKADIPPSRKTLRQQANVTFRALTEKETVISEFADFGMSLATGDFDRLLPQIHSPPSCNAL